MFPSDEDQHPAAVLFRKLRKMEKDANLTEDQREIINDAAHMVNALDVLNYSCLKACKNIGFVYDPTLRDGEFAQAFYWLQEKGAEVHKAATADSKYELLVGVEKRIEDLFKFYQENKNAS
uniref:Uncharacterized protein n=1 Tax=Salmonella phage vB_SEnST11_KE23 TaxID=3161174 RepID=A0AAU8GG77_9CAUD